MIPPDNNPPFRPSFGASPPLKLGGRDFEVNSFLYGLYGGVGSMQRVVLISGARGIGKTVLLNEFEDTARSMGWIVLRAYPDAHMVEHLRDSAIPPEALAALDYAPRDGRRISGVSVAGIGSIKVDAPPPADTPPLPPTLISRLRALARAAHAHEAGILLTLDEIQAVDVNQLSELATAVQDLVRDDADIAFASAGLTFGIDALLKHPPGTTFMRRAHRLELAPPLTDEVVARVLTETAESGGRRFTESALSRAVELVHGYPYLIQLVGALAWTKASIAGTTVMTDKHVTELAPEIVQHMGNQVHAIALKTTTDREHEFLSAMAQCDTDQLGAIPPIAAIAQRLGKTTKALSMVRRGLIDKELITPARYGALRFALPPYFQDYLLMQTHR